MAHTQVRKRGQTGLREEAVAHQKALHLPEVLELVDKVTMEAVAKRGQDHRMPPVGAEVPVQ